jgi:tRNA G18 (ribose-2'-O)-methylase SpoU
MTRLSLLCVDIRSTYNIGSIFRTADGIGVDEIILCGICPRPNAQDERLPHIAASSNREIAKTALGAEKHVKWTYFVTFTEASYYAKAKGYTLLALEQNDRSRPLHTYSTKDDCCVVVGREVEGLTKQELLACDEVVEITMFGSKESLNVSCASAIALYHLRFLS